MYTIIHNLKAPVYNELSTLLDTPTTIIIILFTAKAQIDEK